MRILKCVFSLLLILLIVTAGMVFAHAETTITYDGYTYYLNQYGLAVLVGWDNSSDTLYVPHYIAGSSVAEIGDSAFKNDDFIKHLDLSDANRMYHIGEYAFANSVLEGELIIPPRVTYVGVSAFEGCNQLTSVRYSSDGGSVSSQCFMNCTSLESVVLTDYITTIKQYAFKNCPMLTEITIPKNVKSIDATAFDDSPNVVLKCYYGSYAAEYAEAKGIQYVILDPENIPVEVTFILGDSDGDGEVTILDATKVQRVLADLDEDTDGMIAVRSDSNGDGLDILDATRIQRFLVDFDDGFAIGEEVTKLIVLA